MGQMRGALVRDRRPAEPDRLEPGQVSQNFEALVGDAAATQQIEVAQARQSSEMPEPFVGQALRAIEIERRDVIEPREPFEERVHSGRSAPVVLADLRARFREVQDAVVVAFGAPPVDGLGSTGGFKMQVQDRSDSGFEALQGAIDNVIRTGNAQPGLVGLFSSFRATQPQLYVDVDEEKAKTQGIQLQDIDATLQAYLGSFYVNDFFFQNRNWQVNLQAAPNYRMRVEDIGNLEVRNGAGERVPLRTLVNVRYASGPAIVNHYNLYPSAEINGGTAGQCTVLYTSPNAANTAPNFSMDITQC